MDKERKYRMREEGLPYYSDDVLERTPVGLKVYEMFDGKEVKWAVREDYISIYDENIYLSTPYFENMTDQYGCDIERIIYLPEYRHVIHGKLNGSELLCQINKGAISEKDFYKIEDFGGNSVHIVPEVDKKMRVSYKKGEYDKVIYFDCNKFETYSNEFDATYINSCFLKSYEVDGKIRAFLGMANFETGEVKPIGFDLNKYEFIEFPLDEYDLLDDEKMKELLQGYSSMLGFSKDSYKNLIKNNVVLLLRGLKLFNSFQIISELQEKNGMCVKNK